MRRTLLFLILAFAGLAHAQPGPVSIRPDCFQFFTFTTTGNSNVFDNRSAGCPYFAIAYSSNGFSGLSLVVQVAPDAGGTPGAFSTYTANSGSNPNTATTQATSTFSGYFPWLRVQLTSITGAGSLSGILYGWRTPPALIAGGGTSGGCPGTTGTPCVVIGPTASGSASTNAPVLVAGLDGNGSGHVLQAFVDHGSQGWLFADTINQTTANPTGQTNIVNQINSGAVSKQIVYPFVLTGGSNYDAQIACKNQAFLSSSSSGNQQVIALSGSTNIRICAMHFSTGTPENVDITTGTGSNCGSGTATIDSFVSVVNFDPNLGSSAPLTGGAGNAICINPASAQLFKVTMIYAQF